MKLKFSVPYKLEFVNTYYHKDIYLKFSFVFPNIL